MLNKATLKILVLDDDPFILKLLSHMLVNLGFVSVTTCDNGLDALKQVKSAETAPDLILLDLNMPVMDGVEFVRHLVEFHYGGSLILVSGEDERMQQTVENLVHAHGVPILGHLHKPVSLEELTSMLEKLTTAPQNSTRAAKKKYEADDLRAAITSGAMVNYYQPVVAVATGEVEGVESLVRWQHPSEGLVLPDQFIDLVEANDLIDGLTRCVLLNALTQAKSWERAGLKLRVSINVSMKNLASLAFADFVIDQATALNVPPQSMVLEVTESQLIQDTRAPLEILTRLRMKRFGLSIDDFGTGHSSLAQLRDIPFTELKIDQGFVHGAYNNDTLQALFNSSLTLAKQLGMKTVAEGVADRADWNFLRQTTCDFAQGFFIAKPMPATDLPKWIESWESRRRIEFATQPACQAAS